LKRTSLFAAPCRVRAQLLQRENLRVADKRAVVRWFLVPLLVAPEQGPRGNAAPLSWSNWHHQTTATG